MNNSKGFTLVEVISVIAILMVIATVAFPITVSYKKNYEKKSYNNVIQLVKNSAEQFTEKSRDKIGWINDYGENCNNTLNKIYFISYKTLVELGYIKHSNEIKNPDTKEEIKLSSYVKVIYQADGTLKYEFPSKYEYHTKDENGVCTKVTNINSLSDKIPDIIVKNKKINKTELSQHLMNNIKRIGSTVPEKNITIIQINPSALNPQDKSKTKVIYTIYDNTKAEVKTVIANVIYQENLNLTFVSTNNYEELNNIDLQNSSQYKNLKKDYPNIDFTINNIKSTYNKNLDGKNAISESEDGCSNCHFTLTNITELGIYGDYFVYQIGNSPLEARNIITDNKLTLAYRDTNGGSFSFSYYDDGDTVNLYPTMCRWPAKFYSIRYIIDKTGPIIESANVICETKSANKCERCYGDDKQPKSISGGINEVIHTNPKGVSITEEQAKLYFNEATNGVYDSWNKIYKNKDTQDITIFKTENSNYPYAFFVKVNNNYQTPFVVIYFRKNEIIETIENVSTKNGKNILVMVEPDYNGTGNYTLINPSSNVINKFDKKIIYAGQENKKLLGNNIGTINTYSQSITLDKLFSDVRQAVNSLNL